MSAATFEAFARFLRARSGLALVPEKTYLLETRLAPILRSQGLASLDALALRLPRFGPNDPLATAIVEAMTTNETSFFRDRRPFEHLREHALPAALAALPAGRPLRIWSAASASGQEAYSIAMTIEEAGGLVGGRSVEIVGTDLVSEQIARARAGLFSQFEMQRGLPVQMLVRYFEREGSQWRARPVLRNRVRFATWNLLGDLAPLGRFDIVFCRNVLIYFDAETKTRVLEAIGRQMAGNGTLYLSATETALGLARRFAPVAGQPGVFVLRSGAAQVA